jgi:hypothetical protein
MTRWGVIGGAQQMTFSHWVAYEEYVRTTGAPITAPCLIDLGHSWPWRCNTHLVGWAEAIAALDGVHSDLCPVARLEWWRARRWETAA